MWKTTSGIGRAADRVYTCLEKQSWPVLNQENRDGRSMSPYDLEVAVMSTIGRQNHLDCIDQWTNLKHDGLTAFDNLSYLYTNHRYASPRPIELSCVNHNQANGITIPASSPSPPHSPPSLQSRQGLDPRCVRYLLRTTRHGHCQR